MNNKLVSKFGVGTAILAIALVGVNATAAAATEVGNVNRPAQSSAESAYPENLTVYNNTNYTLRIHVTANVPGSLTQDVAPGGNFQFKNWSDRGRVIYYIDATAVGTNKSFHSQVMYNFGQWCAFLFWPGGLDHGSWTAKTARFEVDQ